MLPESKAPSLSSFYLICEQHLPQLTTLFWKHCFVSLWDIAFSGSPFASPAFWKRSLFQSSFLLWLFGLLWVSLKPQPLLHLPLWPRWLPQIPRHLSSLKWCLSKPDLQPRPLFWVCSDWTIELDLWWHLKLNMNTEFLTCLPDL